MCLIVAASLIILTVVRNSGIDRAKNKALISVKSEDQAPKRNIERRRE
jgi:hypothetical protein